MTTLASPFLAFSAEDIERANTEWGLTCGPCALAACLGWTLEAVRPHLGDFERRGHMSPTMMAAAVVSAGAREYAKMGTGLPVHGLVRVQWGGPWLQPGVPPKVAYRFTHWIASKTMNETTWIYDINSGWAHLRTWEEITAPWVAATIKRADGTWSFTHRWEVRRRPEESP